LATANLPFIIHTTNLHSLFTFFFSPQTDRYIVDHQTIWDLFKLYNCFNIVNKLIENADLRLCVTSPFHKIYPCQQRSGPVLCNCDWAHSTVVLIMTSVCLISFTHSLTLSSTCMFIQLRSNQQQATKLFRWQHFNLSHFIMLFLG